MRRFFFIKKIVILMVLLISVIAFSKDDTTSDQTDRKLNMSYSSLEDIKYLTGMVSYSKYLTEKVYLSVSTGLTNTFEKSINQPKTTLDISTDMNYKPTSPVSLSVTYQFSISDAERMFADYNVIDYKAYSYDTKLDSKTTYRFTDDLNTSLNISMNKNKFKTKTPGSNWGEGNSQTKSVGGSVSYNLTDNTIVGVLFDYTREKSDTHANYGSGTDPVEYEDVISDSSQGQMIGRVSSEKSLGENASIKISSSFSVSKTTDKETRINDTNMLTGGANLNLTYDMFSWLNFISEVSYSRQKTDYLYNRERKIKVSNYLDKLTQSQRYYGKLEFSVFNNSTLLVSYDRNLTTPHYYLEGGVEIEPSEDIANSIYKTYIDTFVSELRSNLTNKLTFTVKNTVYTTKKIYEILPENDTKTKRIHLMTLFTYEMSLDTTFTVKPQMDLTLKNDPGDEDFTKTSNYSVNTSASHSLGDVLTLNLSYYINQLLKVDFEGSTKNSKLTRKFTSSIRFTFSDVVRPSFSGIFNWNMSDTNAFAYTFSPSVEINPTNKLSIGTTANIKYNKTVYNDEAKDPTINYDFTASVDMTYKITSGAQMTLSFDTQSRTSRVNLAYTF